MEDLSQLTIGNNNYTLKDGEARSSINEIVNAIQLNNSSISTHINDLNTRVDELESYEKKYLTFVALESGTFKYTSTSLNVSFSYSLDNGKTFTELASNTNTPTVTAGQKILWKGTAPSSGYNTWVGIGRFSSSNKFDIEGNIMSLAYGDNFYGEYDLTNKNGIFYYLFSQCGNKIINAKNLILPALTLSNSCYYGIFSGCTSLIKGPELPATTLDSMCYAYMFQNCSALTTAPELPAITLASACYNGMFQDCSALTTAPELPARTLASSCYSDMFKNCSSLVKAPELPVTTLAYNCYYQMFQNCTSLSKAPELPATTLTNSCYELMFSGCTSLIKAPELPATVLTENCYLGMFDHCSSLIEAPELPATTLVSGCYSNMFTGSSNLRYIKALFTTTPSSTYTSDWVKNISASGVFVKNNNAEWDVTGDNGVPTNWNMYTEEEYRYAYKYELDNLDLTNVNLGDENIIEDIKFNNIPIIPSNKSVNIKTGEYINKYFSIINRQTLSSYIKFDMNGSANLYYSNDEGETWILYTSGDTIELPGTGTSTSETYNGKAYSKVMFKGNLITLNPNSNSYSGIGTFSVPENYTSGVIDIEGNILSLLFGDDFLNDNQTKDNTSKLSIKNSQFRNLFKDLTILKDASNLILPSYSVSNNSYQDMFNGCTNLRIGPKILAKNTSIESFRAMFYNCTSLIETIEINLIECYTNCCYDMYSGCTSLVKAYDIICKNVNQQSFFRCFNNCTSLAIPPQIYVGELAQGCFNQMFAGCTALRESPKLPYTTLAPSCYIAMFNGCSSLIETPELPAITLESSCYQRMFANCSNLLRASLPNFTMANNCCNQMFAECRKFNELEFLSTDDFSNYTYAIHEINYHGSKLNVILNDNQTWFDKNSNNPFASDTKFYTESEWKAVRNKNLKDVYDAIGYKDQYLTFTVLTAGVLRFRYYGFSYSIDNGNTWQTVAADEDTELFAVGKKVLCKAIINPSNGKGIGTFRNKSKAEEDAESATYEGTEEEQIEAKAAAIEAANKIIQADVEGNPMSMRYGDNFHNKLLANYNFQRLFSGNTNIIHAHNISLEWVKTPQGAYESMFAGCINLLTIPKLPAYRVDNNGYSGMFKNCTSLIVAPELPATELEYRAYYQMFYGCTSLITASKLPVTVFNYNGCYEEMFCGCTSLVNAPELPATTLMQDCYKQMFRNCTSLVNAPELPATILVTSCYDSMFYGCSSLKYVKALFTDSSATNCLTEWLKNTSNTGNEIFVKSDSNLNWPSSRGVSTVPSNWKIYNESDWKYPRNYELKTVKDYTFDYFTIEPLEDGNIQFTNTGLSYSMDNGLTWTSLASNSNLALTTGNKVLFKGTITPTSSIGIGSFITSLTFNVSGNIMSLLFGDNFENKTDLTGKTNAFKNLFYNSSNNKLVDASNLILPALTLSQSCYYQMFGNCTYLTKVPKLPATTLVESCYDNMFYGCSSLNETPELPATTLAKNCYFGMFEHCTSLIKAPKLPITTLAQGCYNSMFSDCTSLTEAPELLATTVVQDSYKYMFYNCSNLRFVKALFITLNGNDYTIYNFLNGTSATGIFIKAAGSSIDYSTIVPSGWAIYSETEYEVAHKYELQQLVLSGGGEMNVIENIKLNNTLLNVINKTVNIEIPFTTLDKIPLVTQSASSNITIDPYKMYNLGTISTTVNISFDTTKEISGYCAEYMIRFVAGADCQVNLPISIMFNNGTEPQFTQGHTYEMDITDGLCAIGEYYSL